MLTALEAVRNRMYANFERGVTTWLYIDEVQSLFAHPTVVEYFARLWREGRKFGLICTGISQNTSHMLLNANARDMVINSDFFLLHKQGPADSRHGRRCSTLHGREGLHRRVHQGRRGPPRCRRHPSPDQGRLPQGRR